MTFQNNIRISNELVNSYYLKKENYNLGIKEIVLNDDTKIKIYDLEKTICDIIRDKNKIDNQILNTALKEYMKLKDKNLILLYKYAKNYRIEKIVRNYMEVLS